MVNSLNNMPISLKTKILTHEGNLSVGDLMVRQVSPVIVVLGEHNQILEKEAITFFITMKSNHKAFTFYGNGAPIFGNYIRFIGDNNVIIDKPTSGTLVKTLSFNKICPMSITREGKDNEIRHIDGDYQYVNKLSTTKITLSNKEITEECGILRISYEIYQKEEEGLIYCLLLGNGCLVPIRTT